MPSPFDTAAVPCARPDDVHDCAGVAQDINRDNAPVKRPRMIETPKMPRRPGMLEDITGDRRLR
jgi:hypothetical protein